MRKIASIADTTEHLIIKKKKIDIKKKDIPAREHNGTGELSYLAQQVSRVPSPGPPVPLTWRHLPRSSHPATHTPAAPQGASRGCVRVVITPAATTMTCFIHRENIAARWTTITSQGIKQARQEPAASSVDKNLLANSPARTMWLNFPLGKKK